MRTWSSCPVETRCGGCGNTLKVGAPMQTVLPHPDRKIRARIVRCRLCAEGEPPDHLPPPPQHETRIRPIGQPTLPMFARPAETRQPGEDG